jgi:hypothetical protein
MPTVRDAIPALKLAKRIRARIDLAIWNLERLRIARAERHLERASKLLEALRSELAAQRVLEEKAGCSREAITQRRPAAYLRNLLSRFLLRAMISAARIGALRILSNMSALPLPLGIWKKAARLSTRASRASSAGSPASHRTAANPRIVEAERSSGRM